MRDSNDNLVGVVESDLIWYPVHPIFDNSLSKYPVSRMIEKDGNIYEMREFNSKYYIGMEEEQPLFLNMLKQYGDIGGAKITFLAATNIGIAIEEGDNFVAKFEIGKKI